MRMCHGAGYSEMRLPNLMGHATLEDVIPKSAEWIRLLQTGCHPQVRTFLCSLFAPVCLDSFIQPCRSMCTAVRDSCVPILACRGHSWPKELDCERFPSDEDLCFASNTKHNGVYYKFFPKPTCQDCPAVEEPFSYKQVLDTFCNNNFAVKVKLVKKQAASHQLEYEVEGRVEFIKQGLLMPFDTRNLIQQWLMINDQCAQQLGHLNRSVFYVIVGDVYERKVTFNRIYNWQRKDGQLTTATRKWRQHKC
ncbi:secreted frizzled-related protein 2-like [Protopterus annectens]|uniref:secreted frizzled-related protein 2-like n=1 Tax=Protopterus annectens TaxID=7888 RepID=UPI001CF96328|nr:secreted frizzled-related protein 2-like [Protopterus annectens]